MPASTRMVVNEGVIVDYLNQQDHYSARELPGGKGIEVSITEKNARVRTICTIICDERDTAGKRGHWIIAAHSNDSALVNKLAQKVGTEYQLNIRLTWTNKKKAP